MDEYTYVLSMVSEQIHFGFAYQPPSMHTI